MAGKRSGKKGTGPFWGVLACIGGPGYLSAAFLSNLCEGVFLTTLAIYGGKLLDAIYDGKEALMRHAFLLSLLFAAGLFISIFIKDSLIGIYLEKGLINLKRKTISVLNHSSLSWLDHMHTGELSSRITSDLNSLNASLRPVLIIGISWTVAQFVCLGYMMYADLKLTSIVFVFVPVISLLQWNLTRRIKAYRLKNLKEAANMASVASDCFSAGETIKSLALESEMRKRFERAQKSQVRASTGEISIDSWLTPFSVLCEWIPRVTMMLAGGTLVLQGTMSIGELMMFLVLGNRTIRALSGLPDLYSAIRRLSASCLRIAELWKIPEERPHGGSLQSGDRDSIILSLENVSFSYESDNAENAGLEGISFQAGKGDFIALAGESGCGKSTILKLIASLYSPSGGRILYRGRDMRDWDLETLRSRIAYVTQETFLFDGTIRDNITCGKTGIEGGRIKEAIETAGLAEFVHSLPDGLDTRIGERGFFLSGGQRQRISIARALLADPELLLLDEATSALDPKTEDEVLSSLVHLPQRPVVLMAAHRTSILKEVDRIYILDKGRIREPGKYEERSLPAGYISHCGASADEGGGGLC